MYSRQVHEHPELNPPKQEVTQKYRFRFNTENDGMILIPQGWHDDNPVGMA